MTATAKAATPPAIREQVRTYRGAGLRVMPIRMPEKVPAVPKGFYGSHRPDATCEPGAFGANHQVGILLGRVEGRADVELLGLDRDGVATWALLEQALGFELPPTLSSKRDRHRFYWLPAGHGIAQRNGLVTCDGGAIDTRPHSGGYFREPWEWDGGGFDLERVAAFPNADALKRLSAPAADDGAAAASDLSEPRSLSEVHAERLIEAAIEEWPAPGGGTGFHDCSKAFGGACRRAGIDRSDLEVMIADIVRAAGSTDAAARVTAALDAWDRVERGDSAYGRPKLQELLEGGGTKTLAALDAASREQEWTERWLSSSSLAFARRWRAANDVPEPRPIAEAGAESDVLPRVSAADLAMPLAPVEWVCERLGLARSGRPNLLVAPAGAGKTMSAQALALAVASGGRLFGEFPCCHGSVLHIDLDQGQRATQRRYQRLAAGLGLDLRALPLECSFFGLSLTRGDQVDTKAAQRLERSVRGVDLVIIDSLRALAPGIDENASEFGAVLGVLASITNAVGTTWLVLHHSGKSETGAVRGSSAIRDRAGCIWQLSGGQWKHDKVSELDTEWRPSLKTKCEAAAGGLEGRLTLSVAAEEETRHASGAPRQSERRLIAKAVAAACGGMSAREIKMALQHEIGRNRCDDVVHVMVADAELERHGKGAAARLYVTALGRERLGCAE